eukprot:comp22451_c0_seq1/m.55214 comp22451_c0_seq1/g.55214  ORF comp22451_c0_seq1/g.55214 comp22451_c0_seq1/m.55214 type:complete len:381 (+) comp22451_c0_seq1:40-1182(+)
MEGERKMKKKIDGDYDIRHFSLPSLSFLPLREVDGVDADCAGVVVPEVCGVDSLPGSVTDERDVTDSACANPSADDEMCSAPPRSVLECRSLADDEVLYAGTGATVAATVAEDEPCGSLWCISCGLNASSLVSVVSGKSLELTAGVTMAPTAGACWSDAVVRRGLEAGGGVGGGVNVIGKIISSAIEPCRDSGDGGPPLAEELIDRSERESRCGVSLSARRRAMMLSRPVPSLIAGGGVATLLPELARSPPWPPCAEPPSESPCDVACSIAGELDELITFLGRSLIVVGGMPVACFADESASASSALASSALVSSLLLPLLLPLLLLLFLSSVDDETTLETEARGRRCICGDAAWAEFGRAGGVPTGPVEITTGGDATEL